MIDHEVSETRTGRVLVIDDDMASNELICGWLREDGHRAEQAWNAQGGLRRYLEVRPDVVVLDARLAAGSGWDVCRHIRDMSCTPVIFLGQASATDRMRAVDLGVDHWVSQPPRAAELRSAVSEALRGTLRNRGGDPAFANYADDFITLDAAANDILIRGKRMHLSPIAFGVMSRLVQHAGALLTEEQLCEAVWGEGRGTLEQVRDYIKYLRQRLEPDPQHPRFIRSTRGQGFAYFPPQPVVTSRRMQVSPARVS